MGVPTKIGFFFGGFEVTYPSIYEGSESNGVIKFPYTYDFTPTLIRMGAGVVFVDFFSLFVTFYTACKLFFIVERGLRGFFFLLFKGERVQLDFLFFLNFTIEGEGGGS
jgi:hypothetical protein